MIPVPKECLILLEIRNIPEYEQKRRVNDELAFCRRKIDAIKKQAEKSFAAITNTKSDCYKVHTYSIAGRIIWNCLKN